MIEKNTVLLDIAQYDYFKEVERELEELKSKLGNCIIKLDKDGEPITENFIGFATVPPEKVQIIISDLVNALDLNYYEIEVKTSRD